MKKIGATLFAVTAILAGACGDDAGSDDDNSTDQDQDDQDITTDDNDITTDDTPPPDASPDAPPLPAGCDWLENNDAGNGLTAAGAWEITGLNLATTVTACGKVDGGHFEPGMNGELGVVDIDGFTFNITADSEVFVSLSGTGLETAPNLVAFLAYIGDQGTLRTAAALPFYGTHGAASASLSAEVATEYFLIVQSLNDAAVTPTANYKLRVAVEATRPCPAAAGAANFTEARDGATNDGNDVLQFLVNDEFAISYTTVQTTDAPEATGLTIATPSSSKISGNSAAQTTTEDDYFDGDLYEFTTGATTDQGRFRLSWPAGAPVADIDMFILEKPAVATDIPTLIDAGATIAAPEFASPALKPNTTYWVWVGGYEEAPSPFPKAYDLQICGEVFTAP